MELGKQIKALRQQAQLSQEALADRIYVSRQTISNWENNNIQPSVEMAVAIADFFGVSLDDLLGRAKKLTLCVDGLTDVQIQHLNALVQDLRACSH